MLLIALTNPHSAQKILLVPPLRRSQLEIQSIVIPILADHQLEEKQLTLTLAKSPILVLKQHRESIVNKLEGKLHHPLKVKMTLRKK
jgi:hypothetical protein